MSAVARLISTGLGARPDRVPGVKLIVLSLIVFLNVVLHEVGERARSIG